MPVHNAAKPLTPTVATMIAATIPFGLGWFVLCPVIATSIYASYKDIFGAA